MWQPFVEKLSEGFPLSKCRDAASTITFGPSAAESLPPELTRRLPRCWKSYRPRSARRFKESESVPSGSCWRRKSVQSGGSKTDRQPRSLTVNSCPVIEWLRGLICPAALRVSGRRPISRERRWRQSRYDRGLVRCRAWRCSRCPPLQSKPFPRSCRRAMSR